MKQEDLRTGEKGATRTGSLCTGYGGLDMAVMEIFGGKLVWCADNDRHVSVILAVRYPGVPNLGDLASLDWSQILPVDIICTGFPCQDISYSGLGAGIKKGAKSGIWKNITQGIRELQPKIIVVENVAAIRRRGLDQVLGDLAESGYDTVWTSIRAADVGAAHRRERVFILAYRPEAKELLVLAHACGQRRSRRPTASKATSRWPSSGPIGSSTRPVSATSQLNDGRASSVSAIAWGQYGDAIRSWEAHTGRRAPRPTEQGTRGQARLSPLLSEWLMGLPKGFVTDLPLPYSAKHRALGNGVVPQQATAALRLLVDIASAAPLIPRTTGQAMRTHKEEPMEQDPLDPQIEESQREAELALSPEGQRIREGIAEALRDGSTIDHETAWLIATVITPGSGALHQLAMTGEISAEVGSDLEVAYQVLPDLADTWIAALDGYCFRRRDKGAVQGWPQASES